MNDQEQIAADRALLERLERVVSEGKLPSEQADWYERLLGKLAQHPLGESLKSQVIKGTRRKPPPNRTQTLSPSDRSTAEQVVNAYGQ